jgi:hypothetical protein
MNEEEEVNFSYERERKRDNQKKLKPTKWAEMCEEEEEEEEMLKKIEISKKEKMMDEVRKQLFLNGKYHLEDGEVFE